MFTPFIILTVLALLLAILSLIWQGVPFLSVAVILLAVALLVKGG